MKIKTMAMNYAEIETEILKHASEYKACSYTKENRKYKVFTDGFVLYFIPETLCHLDIEKFAKREMEEFITKTINTPCEKALLSDIYKKDRSGVTRKLKSESKTVYVRNKLIKPFENCEFEIIDTIKPIIAHKQFELVGLIMPLRVNENEMF